MCEEKKFRVPFSGFAYVTASSAEEAVELFENDEYDYWERQCGDAEEVDEFIVTI